jgi:hypothetical protein
MRKFLILLTVFALCRTPEAMAHEPQKSGPRRICTWGTTAYATGAYCSSDCAKGVCHVQVCLGDGSFIYLTNCAGADCHPECG